MRRYLPLWASALAVILATILAAAALAHQPFFEEEDIKFDSPWVIDDPTISTAVYATLDSPIDVDYFAFEGEAGQSILLQITIPQIEGQEDFAPHMALLGPQLPSIDLPDLVSHPEDAGGVLLPPPTGPAPTFFEPFSRTSYWERQESRERLPVDGGYVVAVWHDSGVLGRYVFVCGDKEQLGGDLTFPIKMRSYWTPVTVEARPQLPSMGVWLLAAVIAGAVALLVWIVIGRRRKSA